MFNYIIRRANKNDFDNIYIVQADSIIHPWSYDLCKEDFENKNSLYFVAELDDEIVGYADFQLVCDESTLMSIAVKEKFRNNGIARDLMLYALNFLKEKDIKKVLLEVRDSNVEALNLYEALDFKKDAVRKDYYKEPVCDAVLMSKIL